MVFPTFPSLSKIKGKKTLLFMCVCVWSWDGLCVSTFKQASVKIFLLSYVHNLSLFLHSVTCTSITYNVHRVHGISLYVIFKLQKTRGIRSGRLDFMVWESLSYLFATEAPYNYIWLVLKRFHTTFPQLHALRLCDL